MTEEQKQFMALLQQLADERQRRLDDHALEFAKHCAPTLAQAGVRKLQIQYSGSGDSGGVDHVTALGEGDAMISELCGPICGIEGLLDEAWPGSSVSLTGMIDSILPAGFENNNGGQGLLTIDVVRGTWELHHEENVVSVNEIEEEGRF